MERQQELKVLLKRWEAEFLRQRRRKPSQAGIKAATEEIHNEFVGNLGMLQLQNL